MGPHGNNKFSVSSARQRPGRRQNAKRVISLAKGKKQKERASDLYDLNHQNEIFQIAKQTVKERQDITGSNCLKGVLVK